MPAGKNHGSNNVPSWVLLAARRGRPHLFGVGTPPPRGPFAGAGPRGCRVVAVAARLGVLPLGRLSLLGGDGGGCGTALLLPAASLSSLNSLMRSPFQPGSAAGTRSNEGNSRGHARWLASWLSLRVRPAPCGTASLARLAWALGLLPAGGGVRDPPCTQVSSLVDFQPVQPLSGAGWGHWC